MAAGNRIRAIPELNTPTQIYREWEVMEQQVQLLDMRRSSGLFKTACASPELDDVQQAMVQHYSLLDNMLSTSSSYAEVRKAVDRCSFHVYNCVMHYYDIPCHPVIQARSCSNGTLREATARLERMSSNVLVALDQFGVHTEYLANPSFPQNNHWDILREQNESVFKNMQEYIEQLGVIFAILPLSELRSTPQGSGPTQLPTSGSPPPPRRPPNPVVRTTSSFMRQTQDVSAAVDELEMTALRLVPQQVTSLEKSLHLSIISVQSLQPTLDVLYARFSEVDDQVLPCYTSISKADFAKRYKAARECLGHLAIRRSSDVTRTEILRFCECMKPCLAAFMKLFEELV